MKVTGVDRSSGTVLAVAEPLSLEQVQAMLCNAEEWLVGIASTDGSAIFLRSDGISLQHWLEALEHGVEYLRSQVTVE